MAFDLRISEIFSGQSGSDLTSDWFEITNIGTTAWVQGVDADLFSKIGVVCNGVALTWCGDRARLADFLGGTHDQDSWPMRFGSPV